MNRKFRRLHTSIPSNTSENGKLSDDVDELYNVCISDLLPGTTFRGDPTNILHSLTHIITNSTDLQLQQIGPYKLLPCAVKILSLCDEDFYNSKHFWVFQRKKNYKVAQHCYNNLLRIFIPERMLQVFNIVIQIVHREEFWRWEDLSCDIIYGLVNNGIEEYNIVHYLLDKVEEEKTNFHDARLIIRVLNISILKQYAWPNTSGTMMIIGRFMSLFRSGIYDSTHFDTRNGFLKRNIQLCIRKMIKNLSDDHRRFIIYQLCSWTVEENMDESMLLEFSSILEYTADIQNNGLLKTTLNDKLFTLVMRMIASSSALVSVLGNRVLQYLIDRGKNRSQFESPQIFFKNTHYDIKLSHCNDKDEEFLKQHRELFHDTFVEGLIKHSSIRLNLECMYCTICLVAVEVPCGFTAAALVCLLMNIQNLTLDQQEMGRENFNHIHTTMMAVITLICWIHHAEVLYSYVHQVMMERAQWAPHLNPPLKTHYSFSVHHVLWNKPEHFFVDWEVRFGLWKCFRRHVDMDSNSAKTDDSSEKQIRS